MPKINTIEQLFQEIYLTTCPYAGENNGNYSYELTQSDINALYQKIDFEQLKQTDIPSNLKQNNSDTDIVIKFYANVRRYQKIRNLPVSCKFDSLYTILLYNLHVFATSGADLNAITHILQCLFLWQKNILNNKNFREQYSIVFASLLSSIPDGQIYEQTKVTLSNYQQRNFGEMQCMLQLPESDTGISFFTEWMETITKNITAIQNSQEKEKAINALFFTSDNKIFLLKNAFKNQKWQILAIALKTLVANKILLNNQQKNTLTALLFDILITCAKTSNASITDNESFKTIFTNLTSLLETSISAHQIIDLDTKKNFLHCVATMPFSENILYETMSKNLTKKNLELYFDSFFSINTNGQTALDCFSKNGSIFFDNLRIIFEFYAEDKTDFSKKADEKKATQLIQLHNFFCKHYLSVVFNRDTCFYSDKIIDVLTQTLSSHFLFVKKLYFSDFLKEEIKKQLRDDFFFSLLSHMEKIVAHTVPELSNAYNNKHTILNAILALFFDFHSNFINLNEEEKKVVESTNNENKIPLNEKTKTFTPILGQPFFTYKSTDSSKNAFCAFLDLLSCKLKPSNIDNVLSFFQTYADFLTPLLQSQIRDEYISYRDSQNAVSNNKKQALYVPFKAFIFNTSRDYQAVFTNTSSNFTVAEYFFNIILQKTLIALNSTISEKNKIPENVSEKEILLAYCGHFIAGGHEKFLKALVCNSSTMINNLIKTIADVYNVKEIALKVAIEKFIVYLLNVFQIFLMSAESIVYFKFITQDINNDKNEQSLSLATLYKNVLTCANKIFDFSKERGINKLEVMQDVDTEKEKLKHYLFSLKEQFSNNRKEKHSQFEMPFWDLFSDINMSATKSANILSNFLTILQCLLRHEKKTKKLSFFPSKSHLEKIIDDLKTNFKNADLNAVYNNTAIVLNSQNTSCFSEDAFIDIKAEFHPAFFKKNSIFQNLKNCLDEFKANSKVFSQYMDSMQKILTIGLPLLLKNTEHQQALIAAIKKIDPLTLLCLAACDKFDDMFMKQEMKKVFFLEAKKILQMQTQSTKQENLLQIIDELSSKNDSENQNQSLSDTLNEFKVSIEPNLVYPTELKLYDFLTQQRHEALDHLKKLADPDSTQYTNTYIDFSTFLALCAAFKYLREVKDTCCASVDNSVKTPNKLQLNLSAFQ